MPPKVSSIRTVIHKGLKYRLNHYTLEELQRMFTNGMAQREETDRLLRAIAAEIDRRKEK
jgi:hypothetical protein